MGRRRAYLVFTKDNHGSICLVGLYGQYWNAKAEVKIQSEWGYQTALLEFENNTRFELNIKNIKF